MAPSLGRATALVVVACGVVAVAWLPPNATSSRQEALLQLEGEQTEVQQLRREAASVIRELIAAHETLRFLERRDTLSRMLAASDSAPLPVTGPDVPEDWRRWLAEQMSRAPDGGGAPSARVLSAVYVDTVSGPTTDVQLWRRWRWWNSTVVAFDSAAAPFSCLTIHNLRSRSWGANRTLLSPSRWRSRSALGICRYHASFGEPGAGVRAWLRAGGWQFGATEGVDGWRPFDVAYVYSRRGIFWELLDEGLYDLDRCFHGSVAGCRGWLLSPDDRNSLRLGRLSAFAAGWWDPFGGLLGDLEQDMGSERFARFWTSPLPMDSAFASAFGTDAGRWTYDWLSRHYGPLPRHQPRSTDYATTVLIAGLLIAFAAAKTQGRNLR